MDLSQLSLCFIKVFRLREVVILIINIPAISKDKLISKLNNGSIFRIIKFLYVIKM